MNADAVYWKGNQTNAYRVFRRMTGYGSDSYGDNFVIGGMNQLTFLCSGEIGKPLNDDDLVALAEESEDLILVSDNAIVMAVGGNGDNFAGMKRAVFSSIGDLSLPAKLTAVGNITTSGGVTATGAISGGSFSTTGNLTCNAVTASGNLTAQNIISKTGYIGVQTANKTYWPIAVVDIDEAGGFCGYRGFGGMTAIGAGESATTLQTNVETEYGMTFGSENLFVCSDQGIWLLPECNTWANHGTIQVQNNGIYRRLMNRTRGDGDTTISFLQSFLCDKTGNGSTSRYAGFEANTREGTQALMIAYDPRDPSNSTFASIQVRYSSDGVISTLAPTPPAGDRSTQIATTACFDNEGFVGRKTLTSIKSVKGCFWFDSLSGLNIDDNGLDFVLNADWYGLQLGMFNGQDKSQYVFNSGSIWRRYSDSNFGDETWSDWVQIADGTGLIAMKTETPAASDSSTRIASTKWVMDHLSSAIPPGAVMFFAQGALPDGWLICNGSNVSRTTYAALFAAIGTKYGSGNGSTTFTLPNLNAKFIEGTTTTSSVGQTVAAGLPNITGEIGYDNNVGHLVGAFYAASGSLEGNASGNGGQVAGFDASRVSSVYGASSTVQPPAVKLLPCIKF